MLFPAQVGQDLCELHGQPNGGADPASYALLATRDARDPDDPWQVDPVTGEPIASGRRRQSVRYLSDPLVGRLRAFHHGESIEHLVPLKGTWPAVDAARLQVVAGPEPTEITPDDVTDLRIAVAKADIHTVDLSYAPAEGGVEQFGLWHQLDVADQVALRPVIENGGSLDVLPTGTRPARPRRAPAVVGAANPRVAGQCREDHSTGVTFTTTVEIERRSTGRLTLDAKWIDLVDDLRADGPEPRRGGAPLGRFLTPRDVASPPTFEITDHRAELGDTRRHAALIDLEAFSSFSAYFTEQRSGPIAGTPTVIDRRGFARATVQVIAADGTAAAEGVDYVVDHAKGAIAALPRGRFDDGDAVTVRYVPLPVSRTSDEPGIEPFEFVFLSTKAPPPPTVVEVVPAFARQRTSVGDDGDSEHVVVHDGAVLRLYLARPWNVSGDGEQLAVLIEQAPGDVPAALLHRPRSDRHRHHDRADRRIVLSAGGDHRIVGRRARPGRPRRAVRPREQALVHRHRCRHIDVPPVPAPCRGPLPSRFDRRAGAEQPGDPRSCPTGRQSHDQRAPGGSDRFVRRDRDRDLTTGAWPPTMGRRTCSPTRSP